MQMKNNFQMHAHELIHCRIVVRKPLKQGKIHIERNRKILKAFKWAHSIFE
jgi:hypothetical protein